MGSKKFSVSGFRVEFDPLNDQLIGTTGRRLDFVQDRLYYIIWYHPRSTGNYTLQLHII